jgi:hypothetical protein
MKLFLEAIELRTETASETEREFIRLPCTEENLQEVLRVLKSLLDPEKRYRIMLHRCMHIEGGACSLEVIEDV